jgi:dihydroorotase
MMKLLLAGGRVIDPSQNLDAQMDILIENGKVSKIGKNAHTPKTDSRKSAAREFNIIDIKGMVVVP